MTPNQKIEQGNDFVALNEKERYIRDERLDPTYSVRMGKYRSNCSEKEDLRLSNSWGRITHTFLLLSSLFECKGMNDLGHFTCVGSESGV